MSVLCYGQSFKWLKIRFLMLIEICNLKMTIKKLPILKIVSS